MENKLWNKFDSNHYYQQDQKLYLSHILEQYRVYVEMADRVSARRNLANVFFLTLNTTIVGAIGFLFEKIALVNPKYLILFPLAGIIILCVVWWWLLVSYRQLNSAKYKVVGELEKRLPSSPYWAAEWDALGSGNDIKKYLPLTVLERYVPIIFVIIYVMIGIYVMNYIG